MYGILGVGINAASCKLMSSSVNVHLRKVLRIHEESFSNLMVLSKADMDLKQLLYAGAKASAAQ